MGFQANLPNWTPNMSTTIDLNEATKDWKRDGEWRIAPAGVPWIKEGNRISIGNDASIENDARIGDGASIGNYASIGHHAIIENDASIGNGASIGNDASIGYGASIGDGASIGNYASIGDGASIGYGASIGDDASIGDGASIGPNSQDAIDIGVADGYRKCIAQVDGVAYIGAGCRWFTLSEALKHWSGKGDRVMTMCLLQSAVAIAGLKGWKHD